MTIPPPAAAGLELNKYTGSIPDIISAIDVVAGWVSAQEGLKYKIHVFPVASYPEEPDNASLGTNQTKGSGTKKPASMGTVRDPYKEGFSMVGDLKTILTIEAKPVDLTLLDVPNPGLGTIYTKLAEKPTASKAVFRMRQIHLGTKELMVVYLSEVSGFNTKILSQMEVEFGGEETDAGYLLTFSGFVNRFVLGFGHFSGSTIVLPKGKLKPVFSNITPQNAGKRWRDLSTGAWTFSFE